MSKLDLPSVIVTLLLVVISGWMIYHTFYLGNTTWSDYIITTAGLLVTILMILGGISKYFGYTKEELEFIGNTFSK